MRKRLRRLRKRVIRKAKALLTETVETAAGAVDDLLLWAGEEAARTVSTYNTRYNSYMATGRELEEARSRYDKVFESIAEYMTTVRPDALTEAQRVFLIGETERLDRLSQNRLLRGVDGFVAGHEETMRELMSFCSHAGREEFPRN